MSSSSPCQKGSEQRNKGQALDKRAEGWLSKEAREEWAKEKEALDKRGKAVEEEALDKRGKAAEEEALAKRAATPAMAPVPCRKELPKWVCVDWFQTIECHELEWQTAGLKRMKDVGIRIWVVRFAGYFQGQRVQDKCERLKAQNLVDHCSIVSERTGESGKVRICQGWNVKVMFDDNRAICEEARKAGMQVYQICKNPKYGWATLDDAVDAFLTEYGY